MKYLDKISDAKDLVMKEYVDDATQNLDIETPLANVIANKSIHGIYAGTGTPAASLGDNGDVYIHYTD